MKKNSFNTYKNLALITQIGLEMVLPIIASVWLGQKAMLWLKLGPVVLLVCVLFGVVVAFLNLFRRAYSSINRNRE